MEKEVVVEIDGGLLARKGDAPTETLHQLNYFTQRRASQTRYRMQMGLKHRQKKLTLQKRVAQRLQPEK